jgi:aminoglycoside phosphotransferase (APT) family kinase protein
METSQEATMQAADIPRAVAAARSTVSALGLQVDEAVVLQASNRLAVRLLPCAVLARVAYVESQASAEFEVAVARQLAATNSPVAALEPRVEPRVYVRDGFVITLWTYYEPASPREVAPGEFAQALAQLHVGMRQIDIPAPHFTDRVAEAQRLVGDHNLTPELAGADRDLLDDTLRRFRRAISDRGAPEQLLHGEPHPGNVLKTKHGFRFIDLETCCYGPVEFDIAHAPDEIGENYPGVAQDLLHECRILVLAMITTWRWDRDDQFPNGRRLGTEWLSQLRAALERDGRLLLRDNHSTASER